MTSKKTEKRTKQVPIFGYFFEMLINVKFAHLMTKSFAKHKATDELYDELNELHDKFLEVYLGKYGRPILNDKYSIEYTNMSDDQFVAYLKKNVKILENDIFQYIKKEDSDLLSIIDDFKTILHKTLYLLELK